MSPVIVTDGGRYDRQQARIAKAEAAVVRAAVAWAKERDSLKAEDRLEDAVERLLKARRQR